MKGNVEDNIVDCFNDIPDLNYLADFYNKYFNCYNGLSNGDWKNHSFKDDNISRSTDFPFIGNKVVANNKAKYFFIFKGSLQKPEKLSMTVLSCLWIFKDLLPYNYLINRFWPGTQNFHPLISNLGITPEIANQSYVTDFARIANPNGRRDAKKSKSVLLEEMNLLNPELVVLVGAEPRDAFYNEILEMPERYIHVPFSLKGVPKQTQKEGPGLYIALRERLTI
jgi:hypothetical protein